MTNSSDRRASLIDELRSRVPEREPQAALERQRSGALLIDVREDHERAAGSPLEALGVSRSVLELRIASLVPDLGREILTLCGSGQRSLLAADALLRMGYHNVASVRGGFAEWKMQGFPFSASEALDADAADRYSRHVLLPELGIAGQARLSDARVTLVGAGGLGSPAALYLAAAGIGHLRLIDDDRVERSNLQRQIVHADARVGLFKTESARIGLQALNPRIQIEMHSTRLRAENVEALLRDSDVVIDGADNFPTRYLINAACRNLRLPWVYGAVHRFTGQVAVFDPRNIASPCYRCLFPHPPSAADAPNCAEAGVLGVLPGVIGVLQATEAIKLVLGLGQALVGRLLCYDALAGQFRELRLGRDPQCPGCAEQVGSVAYADIAAICAAP
ncbi:MAG: molybdopterin-synthase adenylyltransferase MoeB [Tahibacter sp.]